MPLFQCDTCSCIENTALVDGYWQDKAAGWKTECSQCKTGIWHDRFPKRPAAGMLMDQEGHLWTVEQAKDLPPGYRIVGVVK